MWLAAQRDGAISSLHPEQQTEMVRTALSFASEEGIEELRRLVSNARAHDEQGGASLVLESNLVTTHLDSTFGLSGNALVPWTPLSSSRSLGGHFPEQNWRSSGRNLESAQRLLVCQLCSLVGQCPIMLQSGLAMLRQLV